MSRIRTLERTAQTVPGTLPVLQGVRGRFAAIALLIAVGAGALGLHAYGATADVGDRTIAAPLIADGGTPPPTPCPGGPLHC
jgi:hypothetical protein